MGFVKNLKFPISFSSLKKVLNKLFYYILDRIQGLTAGFDQSFEIFSHFLKKICLEILVGCLLDRKQGFLDYKNDIRAKSKNCLYFKGVTSVLVKNLKFLLTSVFFFKKGLDKLFDYVRHRKQGFVDHKNDIKTKMA